MPDYVIYSRKNKACADLPFFSFIHLCHFNCWISFCVVKKKEEIFVLKKHFSIFQFNSVLFIFKDNNTMQVNKIYLLPDSV